MPPQPITTNILPQPTFIRYPYNPQTYLQTLIPLPCRPYTNPHHTPYLVFGVDVGAVLQQQRSHVLVPITCRPYEGRRPILRVAMAGVGRRVGVDTRRHSGVGEGTHSVAHNPTP